jgi:hypothetical protein
MTASVPKRVFPLDSSLLAQAGPYMFQKWRWTEIAVTLDLIFVVSLSLDYS